MISRHQGVTTSPSRLLCLDLGPLLAVKVETRMQCRTHPKTFLAAARCPFCFHLLSFVDVVSSLPVRAQIWLWFVLRRDRKRLIPALRICPKTPSLEHLAHWHHAKVPMLRRKQWPYVELAHDHSEKSHGLHS
ncbi:uncharacterized protein [Triticum aestivum]|uniref:uncharacterized protein isoform X1 n=1 Tax=Triticum aestivum TaxID=4565 RepID=UPI001D01E092|nr:uncharacterized protein LOC123136582 isoform X1 [Triticum aestivum]